VQAPWGGERRGKKQTYLAAPAKGREVLLSPTKKKQEGAADPVKERFINYIKILLTLNIRGKRIFPEDCKGNGLFLPKDPA